MYSLSKFFLCLFLLIQFVHAQSIGICIGKNSSDLTVYLLPSDDFDGIVSNIQFSIRSDNPQISYGNVEQLDSIRKYIPMQKAGSIHQVGNYSYQKFAGFGLTSIAATNSQWHQMDTISLLKIQPSNLSAKFEIVNDSWTQSNNGDYYAELNAQPHTGSIHEECFAVVGIEQKFSTSTIFQIYPNPANDLLSIVYQNNQPSSHFMVGLYSLHGQELLVRNYYFEPGKVINIRLQPFPKGFYYLKIQNQAKRNTYTIQKQ